jgi:3-deoxy-7-phosphoheptulonate synthase
MDEHEIVENKIVECGTPLPETMLPDRGAPALKEPKRAVAAGKVVFGSPELVVMAGPCAVEDRDTYLIAAMALREMGVRVLRGGAFKPRTSPYSFAGLGREGLKILAEARDATGMAVVTEVLDPRDVELVAAHADILQIGSRNMQNFTLLREAGQSGHPVLLKRGLAATCEEWLLAAEHIRATGNERIILCERGIRTFETKTRNTLDLSAVPVLKELGPYPVVVDPSHACGRRELVGAMTRAAVAVGADGLLIEVHPDPDRALCDGRQSLDLKEFSQLLLDLRRIARAVGRLIREEEGGWRQPDLSRSLVQINRGVANDDY